MYACIELIYDKISCNCKQVCAWKLRQLENVKSCVVNRNDGFILSADRKIKFNLNYLMFQFNFKQEYLLLY